MALPHESRKAEEARRLRDNIRLLLNAFRDCVERAMWHEGMTVAQLRVLFAVQSDPEASSASIARQCQVTPQTLQAMLQRASREKWLVRKPAAHNARILTSSLTPKGAALLKQAKDHIARIETQVWRDASAADLQSMNVVFTKALKRIAETEIPPHEKRTRNGRNTNKPKVAARY